MHLSYVVIIKPVFYLMGIRLVAICLNVQIDEAQIKIEGILIIVNLLLENPWSNESHC